MFIHSNFKIEKNKKSFLLNFFLIEKTRKFFEKNSEQIFVTFLKFYKNYYPSRTL